MSTANDSQAREPVLSIPGKPLQELFALQRLRVLFFGGERRADRGCCLESQIQRAQEHLVRRDLPAEDPPVEVGLRVAPGIDLHEIRAAHPERIFRLETSGDLEGRFDGERFQQVLSNLLSNAVRNGARSQPITLSARGESDKVTVQVKNYGRRIPADQLQVIFNPLVRIPPSVANEEHRPSTSLGLGLYIA